MLKPACHGLDFIGQVYNMKETLDYLDFRPHLLEVGGLAS
jgi:hypothetical protein